MDGAAVLAVQLRGVPQPDTSGSQRAPVRMFARPLG